MDAFIAKAIAALDSAQIAEVGQDFLYDGFNPEAVIKAMKAKEKNETVVTGDMAILIVYGCMRGTNISKAKGLNQKGLKRIQDLVRKYNLQSNTQGADASVLSIGRIMAASPILTLKVRGMLHAQGNLRVVGDTNGLEPAFCFPSGICLLKGDAEREAKWLAWSKSFSDTIKSGRTDSEIQQWANMMKAVPVSKSHLNEARNMLV